MIAAMNANSGKFTFISHWNIKPQKKKNSFTSVHNKFFSCHTRNSNFTNRFEGSYQTHKMINETIFNILEHMGNALNKTAMSVNDMYNYSLLLKRRHLKCVQECGK
jgi:hypothetical protein